MSTALNLRAGLWKSRRRRLLQKIYGQRYLFLMSLVFVAWLVVFRYIPLWGWAMAFVDYKPALPFWQQQWVGLRHFIELFHDPTFYQVLRNTLAMSVMSLVVNYTVPVAFALLLNEIRVSAFKRTIQTISYLPHFVSWVIVAGMFSKLLGVGGEVNLLLKALGLIDKPIMFFAKGEYFWALVTTIDLWKEIGWNSIIFLAAIMGVDESLHEAAMVDGAGRFRRMWHVTLPGIRPVFAIMLVMSIGNIINIGFEKQFLLQTPLVMDYSQVLDLYALNYGINIMRFSYGTTIGIFKSVIGVVMLFAANRFIKRYGEENTVF